MELILLISIALLCLLITILLITTKLKSNPAISQLQLQVAELQAYTSKLENTLKQELVVNRQEANQTAALNRQELVQTIQQFRSETAETIQLLHTKNAEALQNMNQRIEHHITLLMNNTDKNLKQFTDANILQVEKIEKKVSDNLKFITEQAKADSVAMKDAVTQLFKLFEESFAKQIQRFNDVQKEKFDGLALKQNELVKSTELKLDLIKTTVEEKLEKTLSERLGQSFETVGKQLIEVQKGLGEMQVLAQDVGGLKRVLSNVKMRGNIGEVQLSMLLDQILAADQYEANVKTKLGSSDVVEFAIKLPGRDNHNHAVWLPVDAKFPKEAYEQLQQAYDTGELALIEQAQKSLEASVKKMAKDISEKYLDPPHTTDFGIMFLPFEGIYAEVVRKSSLLEDLQRQYKIIVTGPTTLAAILNSLQMGFKTLAIQKRSSEVWQVLGAVKKEFENFGGLMQKAQKNIQTGLDQLDDVMGKRTKAIQRKLRSVETLTDEEAKLILPNLQHNPESEDDGDEIEA